MATGWIKIHRALTEHWLVDEPMLLRAWVLLLLLVNYDKRKGIWNGQVIDIPAGVILTSTQHLAQSLRLTPRQVQRFINLLEMDGMIECDKTPNGTKLTVCNYETYQKSGETKVERTLNARSTDVHIKRNKEIKETVTKVTVSPSIEEVQEYAAAIMMRSEDALDFYDHFSSNGWKVSGRTPMKDWKAAMRRWARNAPPHPGKVREYFIEEHGAQDAWAAEAMAREFYQYYDARGWKVGTGQRVHNWKRKADEWVHKKR